MQHKATGRASSIPVGLAMGAMVSIIMTGVVCGIGGWLISAEMLSQDMIGYCALTALLTSAMMGSITAWKKIRCKRFAVSLASGGIYYLILLSITIFFFNGKFTGLIVTLITIMIGSIIPMLLSKGGAKKEKGRVHRKFYQ